MPDLFSCFEQLYEYACMMEECIPMRVFSDFQEVMQSVRYILDQLQEKA